MSSFEEKKREIERVLGVFQNYIEGSELLDVVYSKKFGYVLLGLPAADSIDDSDVTRLEDPETLVKEIYQNLAYDFMEQEGHSEDYTEATNLVFVKRKCEQKGPKKVSTFSTRLHVVSNVFPKYQMLTF